jgi:hypothetical protein
LKDRYGITILYAGLEEKILFAKKIINYGGFPPQVVKFALFDTEKSGLNSIGANRNSLLLQSVGDAILDVENDTLCRIAPAPGRKELLSLMAKVAPFESWLTSDSEQAFRPISFPCEMWFYPSREAALRTAEVFDTDLLAMHERLLGKDLSSCLLRYSERDDPDPNEADDRFIRGLEANPGRIMVTLNGLYGDSGWGTPSDYLFLIGDSFKRLISSEAEYRLACTSREVLRAVDRVVITDRSDNMQTTFFGLDNRHLAPPYLPVSRGADYIYGMTLSRCFDDCYFAHLPWMLFHQPVEFRSFWPGEVVRSASGIDFNILVSTLINQCEFGPSKKSGGEKLRRLGQFFESLGALPPRELEEYIRAQITRRASLIISALMNRLDEYGEALEFWATDVRQYIGILRQSIVKEEYSLPLEILYGRSVPEARDLIRRLIRNFGKLLSEWPDIVEAARSLRAQGHSLARPI